MNTNNSNSINRNKEIVNNLLIEYYSTNITEEKEYIKNNILKHMMPIVKFILQKKVSVLFKNNMGYVNKDDLINECLMGLSVTIDRFDISKKNSFYTYCYKRIYGSAIDYLRKNDFISRSLRKKYSDIETFKDEYYKKYGVHPTNDEICEKLNYSLEYYYACIVKQGFMTNIQTLDNVDNNRGDDNTSIINRDYLFIDKKVETNRVLMESFEYVKKLINSNLYVLNEHETLIIFLYYCHRLNLKEISYITNLTESRISQIKKVCIKKLKKEFNINTTGKYFDSNI